ncbi:GIY-YIG nuclease family protein [Rhizobium puerariae]|uniref:GIY-YIG nuclease family protein n=1 Tax=Rhizobium puerariae TaxID=1585791 RepID=A0ABV6ARW7_9HYPH
MTEYVYFIGRHGSEEGPIKIGVSGNIQSRIDQLQSFSPLRLSCLEYIEAPDGMAYEIERTLHKLARDKRIKRE